MGGCASKPKEMDCPPASLPGEHSSPAENPATQEEQQPNVTNTDSSEPAAPAAADAAAPVEEKTKEEESPKEEPLVDLSSPKVVTTERALPEDTNNPVADLVAEVVKPEEEKKMEETVVVASVETPVTIKAEPADVKVEETKQSDVKEEVKPKNAEEKATPIASA